MAGTDTRERVPDAAERLFAAHGFARISGPEVAVLHPLCSSAKSSPSGRISGRTQEKRETNRTPLIDLLVAAGACGELEVS